MALPALSFAVFVDPKCYGVSRDDKIEHRRLTSALLSCAA
jgi:hypothetical protein